jgi:hypothetical protein
MLLLFLKTKQCKTDKSISEGPSSGSSIKVNKEDAPTAQTAHQKAQIVCLKVRSFLK